MSANDCPGTNTGQNILCLLKSPFAAQLQAGSIWIAVGYSFGIMAFTVIYFSLIRPRHHIVYEPKIKYADKKHCPPPLGSGIFAWVMPTAKMTEAMIVEKVGLDAAIFLRFTRMLRNIFAVLALFGCTILIPVHVTQTQIDDPQAFNATSGITQYVQLMTPEDVSPTVMWAHVVVAYVFNTVVLFFIWWNYRAVARLRKGYFQSKEYQYSLHSRSLWMVDIPQQLRSDEGILQLLDGVERAASLPRAAIARNVRELPELIEEHTETVKKLESVLAKYLKHPDKLPVERPMLRPSKKDHRADRSGRVDAINYLTQRIRDLEIEIKDTRATIDKRSTMPYGFATYDRIEDAHTVAYAAAGKRPKGSTVRLAPKPNDLIWKNMSLSKRQRANKRFAANLWVALLTAIWIVPNAFIAIFLVSLSNLTILWPGFKDSLDNSNNKFLYSVLQAILGPTLLSTAYFTLPIIFRRLSIRAGDLTKTSREHHVTHKLYAFFVFNNLLVFSLFSALWTFASNAITTAENDHVNAWQAIQQTPFSAPLLSSLCSVSVFWITWLLQRNLTAAIDLSQIAQLFLVWFQKTFLAPTPRQKITWTAPQPFDYAQYFNWYLFYATVALSNSMLQPIVLVIAVIIFAVEAFFKKYLLMYVYITKTESGGTFWNILVNRLLFGLAVSHIVGAVVIKGVEVEADAWTTYTQLICMAPLLLIILGFKLYLVKSMQPQCKYYIKAFPHSTEAQSAAHKKRNERIGVKFGHPALYKPLIAPMVHAKAQHLLPMLLADFDGMDHSNNAYGDSLAMDPMSGTQPGMKAHGANGAGGAADMFEVVSEANMDFAYFKNRADFGDEHGGGGELYGHAFDMVSERSGTPASFLTQSDDARSVAEFPPPMPNMPDSQEQFSPQHPAFRGTGSSRKRDGSPMGNGENSVYGYFGNESQSRLLPANSGSVRGYTPVSREPSYSHDPYGSQQPTLPQVQPQVPMPGHYDDTTYSLDRWQTGGNGYNGAGSVYREDEMGYNTYRQQHARAGSTPQSPASGPQYGRQYGSGSRSASAARRL